MRKVTSYKCPECGMKFSTLAGWSSHLDRHHPDTKPKDMTDLQFFYFTLTGKTHGTCVQCHGDTSWNETSGKYNRYCNNPKCKQEYVKLAKGRMIDKYGKPHLLNDMQVQRNMLKARSISGSYKFSDGSGAVDYVGTYEKDFLYVMDHVMHFSATDIMCPSPHNYAYVYEGKVHMYIPDFYIPNYNLEIEIKTDENMHHKIQAVDKVKEQLKNHGMAQNQSVNYSRILDKKYNDFFDYLMNMKFSIDDSAMEGITKYKQTGAKEEVEFTPEQLDEFYTRLKSKLANGEESSTSKERTDFGIPSLKKYPMPDADHVKSAIRFFNYVEPEYEAELAANINKYIEKYDMHDLNVGENNRFSKYYKKI